MADDLFKGLSMADLPAHWGTSFTKTIHKGRNPSINPTDITLPSGYTVVVTGAGKGIGEYIAKAYAEAKAQNIIITSRTKSDLERVKAELEEIAAKQNRKISVTVCPGDATKPENYEAIGKVLKDSYGGRLDCLVNNAGGGDISMSPVPFHEQDANNFTTLTTLNYLSPYYGSRALIPFLLNPQSSGKTLINIVSGAAHGVEMPPTPYNIAKLASIRLTEIIGALYAKEGLSSFAMHPGAVSTPGARSRAPELKHILTDDHHLAGDVCVWLSKEQPTWASGRYISATWDMDEFKAMKEDIVAGDKLKFRMVV